jgi:hypothetical protein
MTKREIMEASHLFDMVSVPPIRFELGPSVFQMKENMRERRRDASCTFFKDNGYNSAPYLLASKVQNNYHKRIASARTSR